jgi:hypothetical protein
MTNRQGRWSSRQKGRGPLREPKSSLSGASDLGFGMISFALLGALALVALMVSPETEAVMFLGP